MEIKGKINVEGFLRIEDLKVGETFTFLDSNILYLKINEYDKIIDLTNSIVYMIDDEFDDYRPVRRIKTTLFIEDDGDIDTTLINPV